MATKRQVAAYERRLSKITDGAQLTSECLGAVVAHADHEGETLMGTLLGYRHETGMGLFGPTVRTWVKLCPSCAHGRHGRCLAPEQVQEAQILMPIEVTRNVASVAA